MWRQLFQPTATPLRGGWTPDFRDGCPSAQRLDQNFLAKRSTLRFSPEPSFPNSSVPSLSPVFSNSGLARQTGICPIHRSSSLFSLFLLFFCLLCSASPVVVRWNSLTIRALPAQISRRWARPQHSGSLDEVISSCSVPGHFHAFLIGKVVSLSSDHLPILISLDEEPHDSRKAAPVLHNNYRCADWASYTDYTEEAISALPPPSSCLAGEKDFRNVSWELLL